MRIGKCYGCHEENVWINWGPKGTAEYCAVCFEEIGMGEPSGNVGIPRRPKRERDGDKHKYRVIKPDEPKAKRVRKKKRRRDEED